jgi:CubicO group peptidase (beta-lactamase class C family)
MKSTSSTYAQLVKESNRAALHVRINGKWVAQHQRDADAQSPAGGVNSSLEDMTKWLRLQLAGGSVNGQQLIPAKALLESHIPHYTNNPAETFAGRSGFYAFGYNVNTDAAGRLRLSHSGAFGLGAGTAFDMMPSEELGIVALTNGMPLGLVESLNATFYDLVEHGKTTRDWLAAYLPRFEQFAVNQSILAGKKPPAHPVSAKPNAAYVGTYTNPIYGKASVAAGPKGLVLALGPTPQCFPLTHWNGNVFAYFPTGENAAGIAAVTFLLSSEGRAGSVNVELLNGNPVISPTLGTFRRV